MKELSELVFKMLIKLIWKIIYYVNKFDMKINI